MGRALGLVPGHQQLIWMIGIRTWENQRNNHGGAFITLILCRVIFAGHGAAVGISDGTMSFGAPWAVRGNAPVLVP